MTHTETFNELFESRDNVPYDKITERKQSLEKLIENFHSELRDFVSTMNLEQRKDIFWFLMDEFINITESSDKNLEKGLIIKDIVGADCYDDILGKAIKLGKKAHKKIAKKEKEEEVYGIKKKN